MSEIKISKTQAEALRELSTRTSSALEMFRPLPHQDCVFKSQARELLVQGGNRCCAADTEVLLVREEQRGRPSVVSPVRLSEINVGDKICGTFHAKSRIDIRTAVVTDRFDFREKTLRLKTKRGYEVTGVEDHPVFACPPMIGFKNGADADFKKAQWVQLKDLPEGWFVRMHYGPYAGWNGEVDEEAYVHGLMDGDGSCDVYDYGVMKLTGHVDESLCGWMSQYLDRHGIKNRLYRKQDSLGVSLEWCNLPFKRNYQSWNPVFTAPVIAGYIRGLMDADGCVTNDNKIVLIQKDKERAKKVHRWLLLFGIRSSLYVVPPNLKSRRPNEICRLQISGKSVKRYAESIGFGEPVKASKLIDAAENVRSYGNEKMWWDRVASVKEAGEQDIVGISTSTETYFSNGILSHNSGKTVCSCVLLAAAILDQQVVLSDGTRVDGRRPHQKNRPLTVWIIAMQLEHVGRVIYKALFKQGLFYVIRNQKTKQWEAYRDWDEEHSSRESEKKPSPPLIPSRFVDQDSVVWVEKRSNSFQKICVIDPITKEVLAEVFAFSSDSDRAKAGSSCDFLFIDESIAHPEHYAEYKARLLDAGGGAGGGGRLVWASWPDTDNEALLELKEKADEHMAKGSSLIERYVFPTSKNKTIKKEAIEAMQASFSPAEALARDAGEFNTDQYRFYPIFDADICSAIVENGLVEDEVSKILRKTNGIPPDDWTKELILDPGTSHPAVLAVAIPPPSLGDYYIPFYEIYPGRCDAIQLAEMISTLLRNNYWHRFIIDKRAGKQTSMGYSHSVSENYSTAFRKFNLRSEQTQSGFQWGCDIPGYRANVVRQWMHVGSNGFPKLRIVGRNCPRLLKQLRTVAKKKLKNIIDEERKSDAFAHDLVDCLEYGCASNPTYVEPKHFSLVGESMALRLLRHLQSKGKKESSGMPQLGPSY